MSLPVHRWYRYSAGFSAEWVELLLMAHKNKKDALVLDPFAGSGTTLLAADSRCAASIGVDAHPFVARIARAKLMWETPLGFFLEKMQEVVDHAKFLYATSQIEIDDLPSLIQKTYDLQSIRKLEALRLAWNCHKDDSNESELVWLAITAILRACSHASTAPWQYVLPKKSKVRVADPFDALDAQCRMMKDDMLTLQAGHQTSQAIMLFADARLLKGVEDDSVTSIITSPPYANNYDYADATRLEMTFWREVASWGDLQNAVRKHLVRSCTQHVAKESLQLDSLLKDACLAPLLSELEPLCKELEEERHLHGGKKQYHLMVAAYFADMARVWQALRRVSKEDVKIHFVIGDSAPYGIYVPVARWHGMLARSAGFDSIKFEKTRDRNIKWRNRTHSVLLSEGHLQISGTGATTAMKAGEMARTGSATHKLGQMVGNFFEKLFEETFEGIAGNYHLYCDSKGARPKIRGARRKVTWKDAKGTPHDLDYVLERNASENSRGKPVAFLELAWRRYTKHSRNKAGEIEGALYHLGTTYPGAFLGAILAGEWSKGSLEQMQARGISVLHISFEDIATTFDSKGIDLRYDEKSSDDVKWAIIDQWDSLTEEDLDDLEKLLAHKVSQNSQTFFDELGKSFERRVVGVRVWSLFGKANEYSNVEEAINALGTADVAEDKLEFVRFEVQIRFNNNDKIEGEFHEREMAVEFLQRYLSAL